MTTSSFLTSFIISEGMQSSLVQLSWQNKSFMFQLIHEETTKTLSSQRRPPFVRSLHVLPVSIWVPSMFSDFLVVLCNITNIDVSVMCFSQD